jgi:outer membrane protein OmpA-like peptidoglycan-associated protein
MKMNRIVFPLALALAATLATTGCKHTPVKITPIPGATNPNVGNGGDQPGTLPPGGVIPGGDGGGSGNVPPGGGNTSTINPGDVNEDRAALAANTIHFAFDSAAIKKGEKDNLVAVASALKSSLNDKLLIEGNCDERGTDEYNRALGERRALAAREALAKLGVSADRIRTLSNGKDKPTDPGHDDSAWAKNRNDTFVLLHPKP